MLPFPSDSPKRNFSSAFENHHGLQIGSHENSFAPGSFSAIHTLPRIENRPHYHGNR